MELRAITPGGTGGDTSVGALCVGKGGTGGSGAGNNQAKWGGLGNREALLEMAKVWTRLALHGDEVEVPPSRQVINEEV